MKIGLRELIFLVVLAGLPLGAWWFVFKPNNEQIAQTRTEILSKQAKLAQLEAATRNIESLGDEIDKLTKAIEVFEDKLPSAKEVDVILQQVTQLASRNGLKTRSVRAEKPVKEDRYTEIPLKMIMSGDFNGYYGFLLEIERLSRITRIPTMELTKLKEVDEGQMEADFTLSIFFEPQSDAKRGTVASFGF